MDISLHGLCIVLCESIDAMHDRKYCNIWADMIYFNSYDLGYLASFGLQGYFL
jgi:hypothetical protein